jgi:hypothetical protein
MPLTSSTSLHDLGAFIFGDNALHLKQQVILRALAEGPVQEDQVDAAPAPFVDEQNLIRVVAR